MGKTDHKKFIPIGPLFYGRRGAGPRRRKNKRYRTRKRYPQYKHRLVEKQFCLDANFLTSRGFFKSGRGPKWIYKCENKQDGFIGRAKLTLIDSPHIDELAIRIEPSQNLLANNTIVNVTDTDCNLGGVRWWFICPRCNRKRTTLFFYYVRGSWIEKILACRKCHRLVYWSQARGINRIGLKEYRERQELYRIVKNIWIDVT